MGILTFGAGALLGLFLGIVLISLAGMAQEADRVYDWLERGKGMAVPEDTYYGPPSEAKRPISRRKKWPAKNSGWWRAGKVRITSASISPIRGLRGVDLHEIIWGK
jgi:hypothetical protein